MLNVYFESDQEVICFCESLFKKNKQIELNWKTDKDWGNHIQFNYNNTDNQTLDVVAQAMVTVFLTFRLSTLIKQVIQDDYFFSNMYEIERISDITYGSLTGEDLDCPKVIIQNDNPERILHSIFITNLKSSTTIHFDSIVKFQLKPFKDKLVYYVGLAIDEFKREEDHQTFVNMLREYIEHKKPKFNEIYLIQGEYFTFYKSNGKSFTTMELRTIMREEPLYMVGLDNDEMNLAPLIAMAPERIHIYGDHPSEPKTLTVLNVFQERVRIYPSHEFPFSQKLERNK